MTTNESRPPLSPFTLETATGKVRLAEDGWNGRNPGKVALVYTPDPERHNAAGFITGSGDPATNAVNPSTAHWLSHQLNVESLFHPGHALSIPSDRYGKLDGIQRGENMNDSSGSKISWPKPMKTHSMSVDI